MTSAVVFDVNETLLDLAALDPLFAEWFGRASVRREWFAQTLHVAMTLAATRAYRGFDEVGAAASDEAASDWCDATLNSSSASGGGAAANEFVNRILFSTPSNV